MVKQINKSEEVVPEGVQPVASTGDGGGTTPPPPPTNAAPEPPPDPFDPDKLRLSQNFLSSGGVKQHITSVPARKPTKEEWFQINPSPSYTLDTLVLELKEPGNSGETYLIAPELHGELVMEKIVTMRRIFVAINRQGSIFIWPARLPSPDGRQDRWAESALEAAQAATTKWVRMQADMGIGAYVFYTPLGELPPPTWPDMDLRQLLKLAFRNNYVDSHDHIVLRRFRGEI